MCDGYPDRFGGLRLDFARSMRFCDCHAARVVPIPIAMQYYQFRGSS